MKRLLLATSILALAAGSASAQGVGGTPLDTPRSLAPSSPSTSAPSGARTMSASSSVSSTTNAAQASPDQVTDAQRALRQQGLYKGPVDGKIGPETRTAISQFQKQNGLKQTAQLDEQTIGDLQGGGASSGSRMPSNSSMPGVSGDRLRSPGVGSSGTDKDDDNDAK
jgi:peptidoglycan hydrolase-like protein with peptidoglycan-binding domain